MKKPVIFFQFDYDEFRRVDYPEGYFDYRNNKFGKSCTDCNEVLEELEKIVLDDFQPGSEFLDEHNRIFKYWDTQNSDRIFKVLTGVKEER
jgi:CDP-glycerol glycerophosphotransferase (TagB/SpsB family)